ncbi:protease inhibitor I42 family protein [Streptomyces sp. NPDC093589]|uniref:protease inhibitor I42 family protein n=1 Tax=Streptomyces sp. NPDC093589 TaxID=3366043 RepID=UPI003819649F
MGNSGISKKSRLLVIAVAIAALVIAAHSVISQLSGPQVYGADSPEISVSVGGSFSVKVPDDPADGYRWIIAEPRPDPAVLKTTGGHVATSDPAPPGGGFRFLDFEALRTGRTDLRLLRCRQCGPGAADEPGARSLNFRITID